MRADRSLTCSRQVRSFLPAVLGTVFVCLLAVVSRADEPPRMKRADAFLGIHFDFHAGDDCDRVGARTTREMVELVIDKVNPDYIQIDCKGHRGYSSYPTKVGNPAPGFVGDPLRVWRNVTRERGIALFMHYSGVWDYHAARAHPQWAAVNADGKPNSRATSVFGPYVDKLMIPQLRELAGEYGVDGVWVDGDCWGTTPDYGQTAVREFCKQTGAESAPRKAGEPYWNQWMDFHRDGFRRYLRHYVDELKSSHPDFQVISNWAFSDHMPEPVSADVAGLSGDFSPDDSVNSARFAGRCLEDQGVPWDLMSWSFSRKTRKQKPAVQLMQEAAVVLALGGGYQAYFKQDRDGAVRDLAEMDVMAEVAQFCRDRQAYCHRSVAVPQIALLYSTAGHYRESPRLFHWAGSNGVAVLRKALTQVLQNQYGVQILSEHHLKGKMPQWPVIIVPGWNCLEPDFRDELAAYAKTGGSLLLIGPGPAKLFETELAMKAQFSIVAVESVDDKFPSVLRKAFPAPIVEVHGAKDVDVSPRMLNGRLSIHLVNTSGPHANAPDGGITTIEAVGPLTVSIRLERAPKSTTMQPEGKPLDVTWRDGQATVAVPPTGSLFDSDRGPVSPVAANWARETPSQLAEQPRNREMITMYRNSLGRYGGLGLAVVSLLVAGSASQVMFAASDAEQAGQLRLGWASADLTPEKPVVLTGFSRARVSEGVLDPITATVLAIESVRDGAPAGMVIMVSCDLISISDELRDRVRAMAKQFLPEIDANRVVLNATHTHCAPETRTMPDLAEKLGKFGLDVPIAWSRWGIDLGAMSPLDYLEFASDQIAKAIEQAWKNRKPGGVSFGLGHAVVGHNRLTAYADGRSQMYGSVDRPNFSHIEGYEDHSVNLLYTWNADRELTGVLINVAVPSQASGGSRISADFWHETRNELRKRLGTGLFVFPQCSAAGDQSPVVLVAKKAEARMERLTGRSRREQIAVRIADAVTSVLPVMEKTVDWDPAFSHRMERVELSRRRLSEQDIKTPRRTHHRPQLETVEEAFERLREEYRMMRRTIEEQPELKQKRGWYNDITGVYWRMARASRVLDRFELQKTQPAVPVEVHVIRLGDMAIATNPFELYLDFGSRMKARSKAVQTFVAQLAGSGSYVPTERSVAGGAYGAIPESTEVGPEGGRELVERTLELLDSLWAEQ